MYDLQPKKKSLVSVIECSGGIYLAQKSYPHLPSTKKDPGQLSLFHMILGLCPQLTEPIGLSLLGI